MYLKNIFIENMGAIEKFILEEKDLIKKDANPKVIIFVGQNGSGKTTLLSSIVDFFYQLAQGSFDDILPKDGMGYKYFKISGMNNKRVHTEYGFSYLQFEKDSKKYEYIDKNGKLSFEECQSKTNNLLTLNNEWKSERNHKENTSTKNGDDFSKDFQANSYCYFPSDRFEYPYWINEETVHQQEQFNDYSSFSGRLDKSIIIRQSILPHQPKQPQRNPIHLNRIICINNHIRVGYISNLFKRFVSSTYLKNILIYSKITNITIIYTLKTRGKKCLSNCSHIYLYTKLIGIGIEYICI